MTNQIVSVNVNQIAASSPDTLQQTGALISQGGTNTAPGTSTLLTSLADLTAILNSAKAITSMTWLSNVVTATTAVPHGLDVGDDIEVTIAGATPSGYNGTYLATITGASTFTFPKTTNPGVCTVPGTYTLADVAELLSMATTFFNQGSQQAVYVLELGPESVEDAVADLSSYLTQNPGTFYALLVPRAWADEPTFLTLVNGYNTTTSRLYFYVTMTEANYTSFTALMKSVFGLVESPTKPAGEFSCAAPFWNLLHYRPSSANKVGPFAFKDLFAVTAYPLRGNAALLAALKAAGVNYVGTGAEGGLTNTILFWGTTKDGRDVTYWYSVDNSQINVSRSLAAAVINGSNNPINPLYYNQDGINRLQAVAAGAMSQAVTNGLALGSVIQTALDSPDFSAAFQNGDFAGQVVINAVPFVPYAAANPGDYPEGLYTGLAIVYTPARGFISIVFNLDVTDFVTQ